jgi:hypothetical protein
MHYRNLTLLSLVLALNVLAARTLANVSCHSEGVSPPAATRSAAFVVPMAATRPAIIARPEPSAALTDGILRTGDPLHSGPQCLLAAWKAARVYPIQQSKPPSGGNHATAQWLTSYARATAEAESQNKMLLVYFCDACGDSPCNRFKAETLDNPKVRQKLRDYVCVQLPLTAKITVQGKEIVLLEHEAFHEMLGRPGIAIVDYRSSDPELRGTVVSTFPIAEGLWYTPERMAVILDLPAGTLTQRTLIYAVRTHPDRPASADGELNPTLVEEAESHSRYQASIRLQGHHFWNVRFNRINARLPRGLSSKEVCAESWPGQNLVESAVECVRCWRLSSGHWSAVHSSHSYFGYDMKRGENGVWYATGIFSNG